jgi:hypothetical protein
MAFSNSVKKALSLDNISKNIDGALDVAKRILTVAEPVKELVNSFKPGTAVGPSVTANIQQQGAVADAKDSQGTQTYLLIFVAAALLYFIVKRK